MEVPVDLRTLTAGARFSLARAGGVSVLALARGGIVRVVSSRDDGESWAPSTVAYDAGDAGPARAGDLRPDRLLSLGDRVLLYAGATAPGAPYPALISDDFGASWRAPGEQRDRVKLSRAGQP
jgi:hypothetical protein